MYILGLTGSIGMGKTTVADTFRHLGIRVYDADANVHKLLGPGGAAVEAVREVFPSSAKEDYVDRTKLGSIVFSDKISLIKLEAILHPMLNAIEYEFLRQSSKAGERLAVLDIPLLFEVGLEKCCDGVAVVSAPEYLQRRRVLSRPGMSEERYLQVKKTQLSNQYKVKKADFLIQTGIGRKFSLSCVRRIIKATQNLPANCWSPNWLKLNA